MWRRRWAEGSGFGLGLGRKAWGPPILKLSPPVLPGMHPSLPAQSLCDAKGTWRLFGGLGNRHGNRVRRPSRLSWQQGLEAKEDHRVFCLAGLRGGVWAAAPYPWPAPPWSLHTAGRDRGHRGPVHGPAGVLPSPLHKASFRPGHSLEGARMQEKPRSVSAGRDSSHVRREDTSDLGVPVTSREHTAGQQGQGRLKHLPAQRSGSVAS